MTGFIFFSILSVVYILGFIYSCYRVCNKNIQKNRRDVLTGMLILLIGHVICFSFLLLNGSSNTINKLINNFGMYLLAAGGYQIIFGVPILVTLILLKRKDALTGVMIASGLVVLVSLSILIVGPLLFSKH